MKFEREHLIEKKKAKLKAIIDAHRPSLMLGGFMATDMRCAKAAYDGGCRIFESNHPAMALQMGLRGVTTMGAAEKVRHLVPLERMVTAVEGLRAVVGDDVFVTVAARGTFTEEAVTPFTFDDALKLANAGADCLHTHKSDIEDVREITKIAHAVGLLCEAYIDSTGTFGVQAKTNEELIQAIKDYEDAGVDIIGLETGMIYQGLNASGFSVEFEERVKAFIENCHAFTSLEGGIKEGNIMEAKKLGFDILVMSTAMDDAIRNVTTEVTKRCNVQVDYDKKITF